MPPSRRRLIAFRVLAAFIGLLFVAANVPVALSPWGTVTLAGGTEGIRDLEPFRWSAALAGGPDIAGGLLLLTLAWRPSMAPVALHWLALAALVYLVTQIPFYGPVAALLMIPFILVLVVYPGGRSLLSPPWTDGVHVPILVLGIVVTIPLLVDAVAAMTAQLRDADALAERYMWASNAEHLINLGLAALLAGMRRPGGLLLAAMVAAIFVYLGIAAISVPDNPGSWGTLGGIAALAAGIAFGLLAGTRGEPSR